MIQLVNIKSTQRGVVLVVALIMLMLVTITGVVTANLIRSNLVVVQNFEARAAARAAALSAIQQALADPSFLGGGAYTVGIDLLGDGVISDLTVTLSAPTCISTKILRNAELDILGNSNDASCYQPGLYSLCADAIWETTVTALDLTTGARIELRQGIASRTSKNLLATACDISSP
ncbi:hypothetical protein N9928_01010 [bacterium]|nr:hypothetical protein [bacterium]